MNDLQQLIRKYTVQEDRKIKRICAPLKDYLGVSYFSYFTISPNGDFAFLSNYPEEVEFYFSEQLYKTCPYFVHPDLLRAGWAVDDTTPDQPYSDFIENRYGVRRLLFLIDKEGDKLDGYIFTNKSSEKNDLNIYLSKLELLRKFGRYFVKEASPLIRKIQSEQYNIRKALGEAFEKPFASTLLGRDDKQAEGFLKTILPLSKREQDCVDLYRKGHSAQATAAILGLSRRTVENYFENIKNKLGYESKRDLLS
ncbi:MAG: hypothetical protein JSS10_06160 [Verrucomicrobia bacterium]|nr:hypothetical protein [Verrucomicrobiota bacterium]